MSAFISDLVLWSHTPSPLQSSWGCECKALSHWYTQRTPEREKNKIKQKNFTLKSNSFKVTLIDFFFFHYEKTPGPNGFHLKLFKAVWSILCLASPPHEKHWQSNGSVWVMQLSRECVLGFNVSCSCFVASASMPVCVCERESHRFTLDSTW